jgi:hypothetical protein
MDIDLLATRPLVVEARPRADLDATIRSLRKNESWRAKGKPAADILEVVDNEFINHGVHYARMMTGGTRPDGETYSGGGGIERAIMRVDERTCEVIVNGSLEWDGNPHTYATRVQFQNYNLIRKIPEHTWGDKARLLLRDNMLVDCDCKAFQYYHRYAATKKGFSLVRENRPSRKTNPKLRGGVCKHLEHALHYIGGQYSTIASAMKSYHRPINESRTLEPVMSIVERLNAFVGEAAAPYKEGHHHFVLTGKTFDDTSVAADHVVATIKGARRHPGHDHAPGYGHSFVVTVPYFHSVSTADVQKALADGGHKKIGVKRENAVGVSESLVSSALPSIVTSHGILDVLEGLYVLCGKRGMSRTGAAIRMAISESKIEGQTVHGTVLPADARGLPVVQDSAP